jgi:arylsulfate sulfotransferase
VEKLKLIYSGGEQAKFPSIFKADNMRQRLLKFIPFLFVGMLVISLSSCEKEEGAVEWTGAEIEQISNLQQAGSLLIGFERKDDQYFLFFETDTILVSATHILKVESYDDNWKTILTYQDGTVQNLASLGDTLIIGANALELNPSGFAPLSARLTFSTPVQCKLRITIEGRKGEHTNIEKLVDQYGYNHQIDVHGLYAGVQNNLRVAMTNKEGNVRLSTQVTVTVPALQNLVMPVIRIVESRHEDMQAGLTLVSYPGESEVDPARPFMIDAQGDIRWLLDYRNHPVLGNLTYGCGVERLQNGNLYFGDNKTDAIYEVDLMGNIVNRWDLAALGHSFHHNVQEKENGNFLITTSKYDSKHQLGNYVINDYVLEINRETGSIVHEWDLKESLDQWRELLLQKPLAKQTATINWAHGNAVIPAGEDAIIVSLRFQGLVKLNNKNQIKWILAPHKAWGNNGRGENLNNYLLHPLSQDGSPIQAEDVINGNQPHADFEWWWGGHAPCLMPNGNLLTFDNGYKRYYNDEPTFSRAVEFRINEAAKEVQQVWQYGQERGLETFARAVSDVDYLPETNHVLFCPGIRTPTVDGHGGKIIEVDYATKEVVFEAEVTTSNGFSFHRAERMSLYPD